MSINPLFPFGSPDRCWYPPNPEGPVVHQGSHQSLQSTAQPLELLRQHMQERAKNVVQNQGSPSTNPTGEVSITRGHNQPGSETGPPPQYLDDMAGSRNEGEKGKTISEAQESNKMSQALSNQGGPLVEPALTSSIPARPDLSSSCAGGPQQCLGAAVSGQSFPSRSMNIKDLHMRGTDLHERLRAGEKLTAAEAEEFGMIKNAFRHLKDQSKDQTAQNPSLHVGQPQQAESIVSLAPPQHMQNPRMSIEEIRTRFAHLQEKQKSQGLTALESQNFRALYDYLRRLYSGRQQGGIHAAGNPAVPSLSRAVSSQNQATIPGSIPLVNSTNNPRNTADAQMQLHSGVQESCDLSNLRIAGQPPEAQNFNVRHSSTHGYGSKQTVDPRALQLPPAAHPGPRHQCQMRQQSYSNVQGELGSRQPQLQDVSYQGNLPPGSQAMARTSVFQAGIMPPLQNTSLAQGISCHQSESISRHSSGPMYQRSMTRETSTASLAGQKHGLYGTEHAQDWNELQGRAKRARLDAPLGTHCLAGQVQPPLRQTQIPGSDTAFLQEQTRITLPLGDLDPKVAQETLEKAIRIMQTGGTLVPVPPGMRAFILPQHSFVACRPQNSPSVFLGSSDSLDILTSRNRIALPSFIRGLQTSQEHQLKMQAGVPQEHIKVVVFDDRQNQAEPEAKPMQSSSINIKPGESTDDTAMASDQGAVAGNEDTQVKGPTSEDAVMMSSAKTPCPDAASELKQSLSAVQEEPDPAKDSDQEAKKAATDDIPLVADDSHQTEQAKPSQMDSPAVLKSQKASPEGQPAIPWVPTREEARENHWDEYIDKAVEDWNARPSPEQPDELKEWCEKHGWQDTDDDEEDSPSSQVHGVDEPSNKAGQLENPL